MEKWMDRFRRLWWVPAIALGALAVSIIILNIMGERMADWVAVLAVIAVAVAVYYVWKWNEGRLAWRITVSAIAASCATFCIAGVFYSPYWNSIVMGMDPVTRPADTALSKQEAHSDLQYVVHYLTKVHPALREGLTEDMGRAYEEAGARITEHEGDTLTVTELAGILESMISPLDDVHTGISMTYAHDLGEPHQLKTAAQHDEARDVLTHINGTPVEELFEERRDLISAETDTYGARRLGRYAMSLEGLWYLGLPSDEPVTYTFLHEDGTSTDETVSPEEFIDAEDYDALYPEAADVTKEFVSYELLPEEDLAILTLNASVNNEEYRSTLQEMFAEVREQGIGNVAVDLRRNAGGDASAVFEFLRYIDVPSYKVPGATHRYGPADHSTSVSTRQNTPDPDLAFSGNVYALTSAETLSAAMTFAQILQDNDIGVLIGEVPGDSANGYSDMVLFELPASHLLLGVSSMQMHRIDPEGGDFVEPEIPSDAVQAAESLRSAVQS